MCCALPLASPAELEWRRFHSDLVHALETTTADPIHNSQVPQALVTTAAEARGLPYKHVYILGLAESLFPAGITEEPLFFDSERESLQERGIPLATQFRAP